MAKDKVMKEGRGTGQAEEGLGNRALRSPTPHVGVRINTDGTPRGVSEGSMDWAKVNHGGFTDCE